ncbi:MAG: hypothetical protein MZV70_44275 [Desulfobacterales bacterium]|nr:hypothetical protein [Desulfobacterales bacterium]
MCLFSSCSFAGGDSGVASQTLLDAINDQIKKNRAQDIPKPGVEVSCSLVVSPSHGKAGANVLIRATASSREAPLVGAELTIGVWEPETSRRVHDVTGRFSSGGTFETSTGPCLRRVTAA